MMDRQFLTRLGVDMRTANAILSENGRELAQLRTSCRDKDEKITLLTSMLEENTKENENRLTALEAEHEKAVSAIREAQERTLSEVRAEGEKKLRERMIRELAASSGFCSGFALEAAVREAVSLSEQAEGEFDAEDYFRQLSEKEPALFLPKEDAAPVPVFTLPEPENEAALTNDDGEAILPPLRFLRKKQ